MMAHMNAPEVLWGQLAGKRAGVEIVHVFGDRDARRDESVKQEEIEVAEEIQAFLGDITIRVRSKPDTGRSGLKQHPTGECRGMPHHERGDGDTEQ